MRSPTFAARALDRPAPQTLVNMFAMGGAIADVGAEETAFPERSAPYLVSIDGQWTDPADDMAPPIAPAPPVTRATRSATPATYAE